MNKKLLIISVLCIILCLSCIRYDSTKSTEFFRIHSVSDSIGALEVYVISNPPKDSLLLKKFVESYNLRTLPIDNFEKGGREYKRLFYREGDFLTRDFKNGARDVNPKSPYTYQDLANYLDDLIMTVEYRKWPDDSYRYYYCYGNKMISERTIIIHDLDSFYRAKWIETADIDTTMVK